MENIVKAVAFTDNTDSGERAMYDIMAGDCPRDYYCSCNGANTDI